MTSRSAEQLKDPEYRKAFVASQVNIGIPFQIRALLKSRGWTQEKLAEKTGMRQPRISGMMSPGKTRPNIETLRRLAEAFDCGLMVRFVSFGDLVKWNNSFDPESFDVPDFEHDAGVDQRKESCSEAYTDSHLPEGPSVSLKDAAGPWYCKVQQGYRPTYEVDLRLPSEPKAFEGAGALEGIVRLLSRAARSVPAQINEPTYGPLVTQRGLDAINPQGLTT